jgi:filamentous hemagglutinin
MIVIALGGSVFSDGLNTGSQLGAGAGALLGGAFGKYVPVSADKIMGENKIPSVVYDYWGGVASEFSSGLIKEIAKPKANVEDKK